MNGVPTLPPISSEERLARFILRRGHLRQEGTVRPDAFIPHPWPDLSVTRHLQLSEPGIWEIGEGIARQTEKTLQGRADVSAFVFERLHLLVNAAPEPGNSHHANVAGWPAEKPTQKVLAQEISAAAGNALLPPSRFP